MPIKFDVTCHKNWLVKFEHILLDFFAETQYMQYNNCIAYIVFLRKKLIGCAQISQARFYDKFHQIFLAYIVFLWKKTNRMNNF